MTYDGGKNGAGVIHAIARQMPPHKLRVEAFGGSFPVLRLIKPALVNVGLDLDQRAISAAAASKPALGPGVTILHADALKWLRGAFPVQLAIPGLPASPAPAAVRLAGLVIPAREALVYCDPPYLLSTRSHQRDLYNCEMKTEAEHERLLSLLLGLPCLVMLSGYRSGLYDRALASWRRVDFTAATRRGPRTESLWMNYDEPTELHDARFAGATFRERWALTKQKRRWVTRLQKMSPLKRQALREALDDIAAPEMARRDPSARNGADNFRSEKFDATHNGKRAEPATVRSIDEGERARPRRDTRTGATRSKCDPSLNTLPL